MKAKGYLMAGCASFLMAAAHAQTPAPQSGSDAAASPSATAAPTADGDNILKEIVVTAARRRSESVQATPIAITALNSALLERNQIADVADMARIAPNLVIGRQLSTASNVFLYLRGFGNIANEPAIDPPIALYVDGIYQPISAGTQMDLFGVDAVEVQRGPQGTLLGKNAPTGAISITSRRPTFTLGGAIEAGYERFDHRDIKGRINIPVVDGILAVNAAVSYAEGGNYIRALQDGGRRIFGGEKGVGIRLGILYTPSPNFEWLIQANGQNTHNPQTGMRDLGYVGRDGPFQAPGDTCAVFGLCSPSQPGTTNAGLLGRQKSDNRQISSQITYRTTPVVLTSVTGYKTLNEYVVADVDGSPQPILDALHDPLRYHQVSQELRLSSAKNGGLDLGGHLDWVIGGFYSDFSYKARQNLNIFGNVLTSYQHGTTKSYALFAHFVYNVNQKLNFTFGARQSWDDKTHDFMNTGDPRFFVDDPLKFHNFSFEAGTQYRFTPDKMVYFRFAEGYRNGGYQGLPSNSLQIPYKPETVKTYEIGAKADFFDHHLRTNVTLFQSDYNDLQRTSILDSVGVGYGQFVTNAANARVRGVEFEGAVVPTKALTIQVSATYLQPKYKNYIASIIAGQPAQDLSYFPFPFASKWTFKAAPEYVIDLAGHGKVSLSVDANYASNYYSTEVPYPLAHISGMVLMDGSVRYDDPSNKYYVTVYVHNLTNRRYIQEFTSIPTGPGGAALFAIGQDSKPITWGVTLGAKF